MPRPPHPDPTGVDFVDEAINKVVKKYERLLTPAQVENLRETLATVVMTSPQGSQLIDNRIKKQHADTSGSVEEAKSGAKTNKTKGGQRRASRKKKGAK